MRYIRRRIQRVSGVTVRDERVESRDFSVQPIREDWSDNLDRDADRAPGRREARSFQHIGAAHRERA